MEEKENMPGPDMGRKKKIWIALGVLAALVLAAVIGGMIYWNHMLSLMGNPQDTVPTLSQEALDALIGTTETAPEPTSPEETWPQVTSDENITNIMLVGQSWREGEENMLSDTMIQCSINREMRTLSLVSFMRDLYVPLPAYAGHGPGRNRINVCYALGSTWTRTSQGGMEMLAKCVEQNFGIHVDHTIEIGFDTFTSIIDAMGGVEVELTEAEAEYLTKHVGYVGEMQPGYQTLDGTEALAYARIRKIDSDRQRTARQRSLITSLLDKCREMNLLELHDLATTILPMITTDMTNKEITNYIWEFLPMVKDIRVASLTCPADNETLPGSVWGKTIELYGYSSSVVECNTALNGRYLRYALGIKEANQ